MRRKNGFTLVELLVSITIVMVIMAVAVAAYMKLLQGYKTGAKASENYISDLCGLELLRQDIEMAGYGLPLNLNGNSYNEAVAAVTPTTLNDSGNPPRAFAMSNNTGQNGSDILAIKSSIADINNASKKWSMIPWSTTTFQVKAWGGATLDPNADFTSTEGDSFIILDNGGALQPAGGGVGFTTYTFNGNTPTSGYYQNTSNGTALPTPPNNQSVFFLYGIDTNAGVHRMPFNRVDYYLDRVTGQFPSSCADSYTLYRGTIIQTGASAGNRTSTAVLDCVRDFQVAFGLDTNNDGAVDTWVADLINPQAGVTPVQTAADERTKVREVRIFILYHEGTGDVTDKAGFRFSGTLNLSDQDIAHSLDSVNYPAPPNNFKTLSSGALTGTPDLSSFTPAGSDRQYKWKVLELSIKPMNLR